MHVVNPVEQKRRAPKCGFCRKGSTKACNAEIGRTLGGEAILCDTPICPDHTANIGGSSNHCPRHPFRK